MIEIEFCDETRGYSEINCPAWDGFRLAPLCPEVRTNGTRRWPTGCEMTWDRKSGAGEVHYDFDGKMILGDLNKETVAQVWKGKKYTEFRGIHERGEFEKLPICNNCDKLR